jgi:hypothetical protein
MDIHKRHPFTAEYEQKLRNIRADIVLRLLDKRKGAKFWAVVSRWCIYVGQVWTGRPLGGYDRILAVSKLCFLSGKAGAAWVLVGIEWLLLVVPDSLAVICRRDS